MLPQTAQTTESEEKPHRSHAVIRKARRTSPPPGTSMRARNLLGEFCGLIEPAPPPAQDPTNGPARHPLAGRKGSRDGSQGRPRGSDRRRAGRAAAVGSRRGEDARQGYRRDRAGAHCRPGQEGRGQPHVHGPLGRHAVRDREAVLRQRGPLDVDLRGEPVQDPQPEQHLCRREADHPESRADRHRGLHAAARQEAAEHRADVLGEEAERQPRLLRPGGPVGRRGRRQVARVRRGRDRHGRIRRQAVRPQPDQRLRLLADQRRPRSHGHVQPDQERQAAIAISSNGRNWRPWTTYVTGAYRGRC